MMAPARLILFLSSGLFLLFVTVHAFRVRDAPTKTLVKENILKKIGSTAKCDTCDKSDIKAIPKSPDKPSSPFKTEEKPKFRTIVSNKIDIIFPKKIIEQKKKPQSNIDLINKDSDSEDIDDEDETDVSDDDNNDSEDESDESDDKNGDNDSNSDIESKSDSDTDNGEDDNNNEILGGFFKNIMNKFSKSDSDEDSDESEKNSPKINNKRKKKSYDSDDSEDDDDDDDDTDDDDNNDDGDDDVGKDDDDDTDSDIESKYKKNVKFRVTRKDDVIEESKKSGIKSGNLLKSSKNKFEISDKGKNDDDDDDDEDDEDEENDSEYDEKKFLYESDKDSGSDTDSQKSDNESDTDIFSSDSDTDDLSNKKDSKFITIDFKSSIKAVKEILHETSKVSKIIPDSPSKLIPEVTVVKKSETKPEKITIKQNIKDENKKIESIAQKESLKKTDPKAVDKTESKNSDKKPQIKSDDALQPITKILPKSATEKSETTKLSSFQEKNLKEALKSVPMKPQPAPVPIEKIDPVKKTSRPQKSTIKQENNHSIKNQDIKNKDIESLKNQQSKIENTPKVEHKEKKKAEIVDNKINDDKSKTETKKIQDKKQNIEETSKRKSKTISHVHDAIHRKNLRESDFQDFYTFFPTFAPNFSRIHNPECRRQGLILLRQLRGAKIWPLQMLDSTAKFPSGFLRGNGNQLGDFDQCLETKARVRLDSGSIVKVAGKYCLAQIDLKSTSEEAKLAVHLALARDFIRSTHRDTGHFIPRFTTLNWGVCLPAACGAPEAEFVLRDALRHYNLTTGLRINIHVDPVNCYTSSSHISWKIWMDIPTIATLIFYALIVTLTVYATFNDILLSRRVSVINKDEKSNNPIENNEDEKQENGVEDEGDGGEKKDDVKDEEGDSENKDNDEKTSSECDSGSHGSLIQAFSLKQTTGKLMREGSAEGDIECIHGIRALCSIALYVAHKLIPLAMTPFTNRTYLTEISNSPFSVILRASIIYTDTFLLLSGVLTAYHMSEDIDKTGGIPWLRRYVARYLRLTPALLAVLLWYAYISDKIGDGPLWGTVVTKNSELCQDNMWTNLLYIQNFFQFEDMCASHTHQLALDMQLWWLAPVAVWLLRSKPMMAAPILGALHCLTVYLRYSTSIAERLSLVIFHGITVKQLYRTANLCYGLALHRATPYLAGVSLGVLLQQTGKDLSLPKLLYFPGWLFCLYFGGWALYSPADMSNRTYQYDVGDAAQYAALASVAWALALSWLIFACFTGNGGPLNTLLCSRPLVILSRLSYSMYLCQFLVFFYNVGTLRTSSEFVLSNGIGLVEVIQVLVVSVILTLLFDIPMQSSKKIVMSIEVALTSRTTKEEKVDESIENKEEQEEEVVITDEYVEEEVIDDGETEETYTQEEVYEYEEEENVDSTHHELEQDIIYEEEEEEIEVEDGENLEEYPDYKRDENETEDGNQPEDDDLEGWELTNGANNYYYWR